MRINTLSQTVVRMSKMRGEYTRIKQNIVSQNEVTHLFAASFAVIFETWLHFSVCLDKLRSDRT